MIDFYVKEVIKLVYIRIGYKEYDTDDIIADCAKCGGSFFNAPELVNRLDLTPEQLIDFKAGLKMVGYCPICQEAKLFESE